MDPVGVTASKLTIQSSVNGGIKVAQTLYNAPQELQSLSTEVDEFSHVLQDVRDQPRTDLTSTSLSPTLYRAKAVVQELEELISYRLTKVGHSLKVDRLEWARSRPQIKELRKQLKSVKLSLTVSLSALAS